MQGRYYPLFVSLSGRICVVVGGGSVGERKVRKLLECGAVVRLVARELTEWLDLQRREGAIAFMGEHYDESWIEGAHLVFAATSDSALNRRVAEDAARKGIWCNMATEPGLGTCIVPATVRRGPLSIAISTDGLSPALARKIRMDLEKQFGGPEWTIGLNVLGALRASIQAKGLDGRDNQRMFKELADLPLVEWIGSGQQEAAIEAISRVCHPWLDKGEISEIWNKVWKSSFSPSPSCATAVERQDT